MRKKFALLVGRFQPFHKGHEKIIGILLGKYGRVMIAIGSAQKKRSPENPFLANERKQMILAVARAHAIWAGKIKIAKLNDFEKNSDWVKNAKGKFAPEKFAVASANLLVRRLLKKAGYEIIASPLFARARWQGKKIREEIRRGKMGWKKSMPKALHKWMEEKGCKIIRQTSKSATADLVSIFSSRKK